MTWVPRAGELKTPRAGRLITITLHVRRAGHTFCRQV